MRCLGISTVSIARCEFHRRLGRNYWDLNNSSSLEEKLSLMQVFLDLNILYSKRDTIRIPRMTTGYHTSLFSVPLPALHPFYMDNVPGPVCFGFCSVRLVDYRVNHSFWNTIPFDKFQSESFTVASSNPIRALVLSSRNWDLLNEII